MQALSFAEMLAGGLLVVSAVENLGLSTLIKDALKGVKLPGAVSSSTGGAQGALSRLEAEAAAEGRLAPSPAEAARGAKTGTGVSPGEAKRIERAAGLIGELGRNATQGGL